MENTETKPEQIVQNTTDSQFQQNPYGQQGAPQNFQNQYSGPQQYPPQGYPPMNQGQQYPPQQYQGQQYPPQYQQGPPQQQQQFGSNFQGQPQQYQGGPTQGQPQQFGSQFQAQPQYGSQFQPGQQQQQQPQQQQFQQGGGFQSQFPQPVAGGEQKEGAPQAYTFINDNLPIEICVCDPIVKEGLSKHVVYKVKGFDREGVFEVYRRYNDFFHLRNMLLQRWPGCLIPPIPPKKAMGNMDQKFIADRKRFLDDFCKKLGTIRYLFYSEEVRTFLRSGAGDMEKTLNSLHKQTHEETVIKYRAVFPEVANREINSDVILKITSFGGFLKKISIELEKFKKVGKTMAASKRQYNEQLNILINYLLPEYEKHCYTEYADGDTNKIIFGNTTDTRLDNYFRIIKEKSKENSFDPVYDLVKIEIKEISSFIEAINMKEQYEQFKVKAQQKNRELQNDLQKMLSGKSTMGSLFSKGNKEDKIVNIEKAIASSTREIESLQQIVDFITRIIGHIEIEKYKKEKQEKYLNILKNLSHNEIEDTRLYNEFWIYIASFLEKIKTV